MHMQIHVALQEVKRDGHLSPVSPLLKALATKPVAAGALNGTVEQIIAALGTFQFGHFFLDVMRQVSNSASFKSAPTHARAICACCMNVHVHVRTCMYSL